MTSTSSTGILRAGAAQVDITPPLGTQLAGDIGRHRPAEWIRDPIYARALALELGDRRLCLLSLDCAPAPRSGYDQVRNTAAERFGLEAEAVMVHCTQNHAAPGLGHYMISEDCDLVPDDMPWLRGADDRFIPVLHERIQEAVARAWEALQPVSLVLSAGMDARVAFNRRFVMRDGSAQMGASGDSRWNVLHAEGPTDPEVGVAAFQAESGDTVAMLLHHTCHPTNGFPYLAVTADWPGAWCNGMKPLCPRGVPMVLNGCCGNIGPNNYLDPSHVADQFQQGRALTETATEALGRAIASPEPTLSWVSDRIRLPQRELPSSEVERARQILAQHPEPLPRAGKHPHTAVDWDWVYAVCTMDLLRQREHEDYVDYEIQVFRVGDLAIVGLPGEPFVEGQLSIKARSPVRHTFVAHYCNDFVGYIPTPRAFEGGGYETRTANWSKLAPEALDLIADRTVELLHELF